MNEEDVFCMCVGENQEHIKQSILTNCVKCNARVWITITNCHRKPICISCVAEAGDPEFYVTAETLAEAIKEKDNLEKGGK
jgi:hypothetical protein